MAVKSRAFWLAYLLVCVIAVAMGARAGYTEAQAREAPTPAQEYRACDFCHLPHLARRLSGNRWEFINHNVIRFRISQDEDAVTCVASIAHLLRRFGSAVIVPHEEQPK